jgi:hypothetical protein
LRTGDTPQAFNGFGFSFQAKVLPGLQIGGAYNKTYFDHFLTTTVLHGGTDYWAVGGKALGATLNGEQTGTARATATLRSFPIPQADRTE